MIYEGKVALVTFVCSLFWLGLASNEIDWQANKGATIAYFSFIATIHGFLIYYAAIKKFQIFWRAYLVGAVFMLGLSTIFYASYKWMAFGFYLCVLAVFHISEYLATAAYSPGSLRLESFLINHSFAYNVAHVACCLEYAFWAWAFPGVKSFRWIQVLGFLMCLFGEIFRKVAMCTAGTNFTHVIQYEKKTGHALVTTGIYALCRHPSYAGWFCWSIGTQVLACNPLCFIAYTAVSWKFFDERIYEEEMLLLNFFKVQYLNYQNKVPTGVPFVQGYRLTRYEN